MKLIEPTPNEHRWPRHEAKTVECRKRDLVLRIADWTRDRDEPAYDVEVYIGGVYDWNESEVFSTKNHTPPRTKALARKAAIAFASAQIAKLL
jgi:hypothetical protein